MFDSSPVHTPQDFAARRDRIRARLQENNAVMVLSSGSLKTRSNDTEYTFRPNSDFFYLTGVCEPEATLVLGPEQDDYVLFVRPKDKDAEIWHGRRLGPQGAIDTAQAHAAFPLTKLKKELPRLLDGREMIYVQSPSNLAPKLQRACAQLARRARDGSHAPEQWADAARIMGPERRIKDQAALGALRKACELSAMAHRRAMQTAAPGLHEYSLEAELHYTFRKHGSTGPGYGSIVAAGDNANILHYTDNCAPLCDGDMVLIDAGAEWEYFSGDITRSFPVSGQFSSAQRELYELVLSAHQAGIAACTVGGSLDEVHEVCLSHLVEGLVDLGWCKGSVQEVIEEKSYRKYYMHRTGHWLGLDVHDAGASCVRGKPVPFEADMVVTVEPGLYIPKDDDQAPAELRGTGIRIEDDIHITDQGPINLTEAVPKAPAAIEDLMASGRG